MLGVIKHLAVFIVFAVQGKLGKSLGHNCLGPFYLGLGDGEVLLSPVIVPEFTKQPSGPGLPAHGHCRVANADDGGALQNSYDVVCVQHLADKPAIGFLSNAEDIHEGVGNFFG